MRIKNKALLSLASSVTLLAPLSLTSCGQVWGYLNPISCGSSVAGDVNDPFTNFRGITGLTDGNNLEIPSYLQSNFIINQAKSTMYAYSSPVTKWFQTKEEAEDKDEKNRYVLDTKDWQHLDDGWKTQTDEFSSSVTLYNDKRTDVLKDDRIRHVFNNNENINQLINLSLTPTIATAIQSFIAGALQYQGTQIADKELKATGDMYAAWGLQAQAFKGKTNLSISNLQNFYEFVFANANMHAAGKTAAFMRPTSINFTYDSSFFPFPTYTFNETTNKKHISLRTKQFLLGKEGISENTKFCEQWKEEGTISSYYTDVRKNQTVSIPYVKKNAEDKFVWEVETGSCNQYLFSCVPIIVHVNDFGLEWVNPQKNDSFLPSEYFVKDKEIVTNAVGNAWSHLSDYVPGSTCKPSYLSYTFKANNETSKIQFDVKKTSEGNWDDRLITSKIDGNTFIVLADYVVNEYDDPAFISKYEEEFQQKGETLPEELKEPALANANAVALNGITNIFPAYLLGDENGIWFKKANNDGGEDNRSAYIIDNSSVNRSKTALSKLITFNSEDGRKPHASAISQDGKNLLAFLTYMFGKMVGTDATIDMSFISPTTFPE